MTILSINQQQAIERLKKGKPVDPDEIVFNDEKVEALDVLLLGSHGIRVPQNLIYYDDDAIDFSDDPEWTDEELAGAVRGNYYPHLEAGYENGSQSSDMHEEEGAQIRRFSLLRASISVEKEVADWIANSNRDLDHLLTSLLNDYYKNHKATSPTL